jgi:hypothetical protein
MNDEKVRVCKASFAAYLKTYSNGETEDNHETP